VVSQAGWALEALLAVGTVIVLAAVMFLELLVAVKYLYVQVISLLGESGKGEIRGVTRIRGNRPRGILGRRSDLPPHAPIAHPRCRNHTRTLHKSDDLGSVCSVIAGHVQI